MFKKERFRACLTPSVVPLSLVVVWVVVVCLREEVVRKPFDPSLADGEIGILDHLFEVFWLCRGDNLWPLRFRRILLDGLHYQLFSVDRFSLFF